MIDLNGLYPTGIIRDSALDLYSRHAMKYALRQGKIRMKYAQTAGGPVLILLWLLSLSGGASTAHAAVPFEDRGENKVLQDFVEREQVLTHIEDADTLGLLQHKLPVQPWSDTFWPDVHGSIAIPYADKAYTNSGLSWPLNRRYIRDTRKRLHAKLDSLSEKDLNNLSPSEKYDMIVGDGVIYASEQVDITDKVLQKLKSGNAK